MPIYQSHDGVETRDNSIDEPTNPDGTWKVLLHGGYGNPFDFRLTSDIHTLFPNSYIFSLSAAVNDNRLWDADNTQKDLDHLESLINALMALYGLNYSNGALIGISNGGMMALRLVNRLNFSKVVSVSGTYNAPEDFTYTGKVLLINSIRDKIIPYAGNASNNSIADSLTAIGQTATVQNEALLGVKLGSFYHSWDEIKELTDLNNKIEVFLNA